MGLEETGQALQGCGAALFKIGFAITALMALFALLASLL